MIFFYKVVIQEKSVLLALLLFCWSLFAPVAAAAQAYAAARDELDYQYVQYPLRLQTGSEERGSASEPYYNPPIVLDPEAHRGIQFFYDNLGYYHSSQSVRLLGNTEYQEDLINKQMDNTVSHFFVTSFPTNEIRNRYFYMTALAEMKRLGLTIGTPLTPNQVEALNENILWPEIHYKNGERVLLPRFYATKEEADKFKGMGALIYSNTAHWEVGQIELASDSGMIADDSLVIVLSDSSMGRVIDSFKGKLHTYLHLMRK